jgi:hypothetical protein
MNSSMVVFVIVLARSDDLATVIRAAHGAHAMGSPRAVTARAVVERRGDDPVLRAPLRGAAV